MAINEITATGKESLELATHLLQRARLSHPTAGVWEAADIQWNARMSRESDKLEQRFWIDDSGPVAGVMVTSSSIGSWQLDPILVHKQDTISQEMLWEAVLVTARDHSGKLFSIPIADDDVSLQRLAESTGMQPDDKDYTGWLSATDAVTGVTIGEGFTIKDRTELASSPHPMSDRNGPEVGERLAQCSLYDPELDLCVQSDSGEIAGYSLYWFDPVTRVGLVEPVRVHDTYQRRGLARAMVAEGIRRLIDRGAERIKVSWETEAAGALYQKLGFLLEATTTWYSNPVK